MKKIIFYMMTICALMSCQDNENVLDETVNINKRTHAISIDEALANLHAFMNDSTETRSCGSDRIVKSIKPVKISMIQTRSTQEISDCENVVYVANFENEEGYAILAADDRVEADVIAITDEGNISDATIYEAVDLINSERPIIEEYPETGAGFVKLPEYEDELFMNPNTACLYNDTVQDTMVGNIFLDDEGVEDEFGNPTYTSTNSDNSLDAVSTAMCMSYAIEEINEFDKGEVNFESANDKLNIDLSVESGSTTQVTTTTSEWKDVYKTTPILTNFVYWHQREPFNDKSPRRRKYVLFGNRRKAPVGCFPLAVAKIMSHFEYPENCSYNGYNINWNEVNTNYYSLNKNAAAHLLRMIGAACDSWYFYKGTFTFPSNVTSFMRKIGYDNAHSYDYSFSRVKRMIDSGSPLIIYAVPGINIFKSHSWNIDGYKIKERTITTNTYSGDSIINTSTKTETRYMVHCDFGHKGNSNGYYVSGVFKQNDANAEHDYSDGNGKENYTTLIKVITYDRPN